jgi:hypothetical protein
LIDASTQQDLRTLADGATIDLSVDGSALNVRANISGAAASVVFVLDGAKVGTENMGPYALALV